jgi:argininosuccinate lyase
VSRRDAEAAGWLSAGRARREASTVAYRLAVRQRLLDLADGMTDLVRAVLEQATAHASTLMPDYTYLQQAHPTTFGHYLMSFAYPMLRDLDRLQACFQRTNAGPGGIGSINGSRLPVDRHRLADLLGFDAVIPNARDAMWQPDGPIEVMALAVALLVTLDRLAEDLMIWSTQEFSFVEVADRHARASVIMPHKKNPYSLAFVRGVAGVMIGRLASMASVGKTPSAQVDNRIFAYGEVPRSLDLTIEAVRLMAGVIRGLSVDVDSMAERANHGHGQATDLAEVIMGDCGLSYREAHKVVGRVVRVAVERGMPLREVDTALIDDAAQAVLGRSVKVAADRLAAAVDPVAIVASRTGLGGAAPEPMRQMLGECHGLVLAVEKWRATTHGMIVAAEDSVVKHAAAVAESAATNETRHQGRTH